MWRVDGDWFEVFYYEICGVVSFLVQVDYIWTHPSSKGPQCNCLSSLGIINIHLKSVIILLFYGLIVTKDKYNISIKRHCKNWRWEANICMIKSNNHQSVWVIQLISKLVSWYKVLGSNSDSYSVLVSGGFGSCERFNWFRN